MSIIACSDSGGGSSSSGTGERPAETGKAGSQSRFAIIGDYLYAIAGANLQLFALDEPAAPQPWADVYVRPDIETTFGYGNYLFIGARDGMYIYDNTDPAFPRYVSELAHRVACDPVVVQGDYAYITLQSGRRCGPADDLLEIVDISDILHPFTLMNYPMQQPSGLGIDGGKLFVCDGSAGLKIFDASDPLHITPLETLADLDCYDVIPNNNVLIVSDDFGILQYDYTNLPVQLLSEISL